MREFGPLTILEGGVFAYLLGATSEGAMGNLWITSFFSARSPGIFGLMCLIFRIFVGLCL